MPFINNTTGGASAPTGEPLLVADTAERLALTPTTGMRVRQLDDNIVYAYDGSVWFKAPYLEANTSPSQVATGVQFQSDSYPNVTYGTLVEVNVTSTKILPNQAFADNIEKFALSENPITLVGASYLDQVLFTKFLTDCNNNAAAPELYATDSPLTNVADLLSYADTFFTTYTPGLGGDFHFVNATAERINPFNANRLSLISTFSCTVSVRFIAPHLPTVDPMGWTDQSAVAPQPFDDGIGNAGLYFPPATTAINASTTNSSGPVQLNLANLPNLLSVYLSNANEISSVINPPASLQSFTGGAGVMQSLNLSNLPNLNTMEFNGCSTLTSVRVENCSVLTSVDVNSCDLSGAALDDLIIDIHANAAAGAVNGTLNVSSQFSMPAISETTKLGELTSLYGWTITT